MLQSLRTFQSRTLFCSSTFAFPLTLLSQQSNPLVQKSKTNTKSTRFGFSTCKSLMYRPTTANYRLLMICLCSPRCAKAAQSRVIYLLNPFWSPFVRLLIPSGNRTLDSLSTLHCPEVFLSSISFEIDFSARTEGNRVPWRS
jgi:hypothetical protein